MNFRLRMLLVLVIVGLFVSGCELAALPTPSAETAPTPVATEQTIVPTSTVTVESAGIPTIGKILQDDEQFSMLYDILLTTGLTETLSLADSGPYTFLAPTNDAFEQLPEELKSMMADPTPRGLGALIRQHILGGRVPASEMQETQTLINLAGIPITITLTESGDVILDDSVLLIGADLEASNGLIHVIDAVLLTHIPKSDNFVAKEVAAATAETMANATATPAPEATLPAPTMAEILASAGNFNILLSALDSAKLIDAYTDAASGPYTIFAPTDEAFAALPDGTLDLLLADPDFSLKSVLRYHMLAGRISADTIAENSEIIPLSRDPLWIRLTSDGTLLFNGESRMTSRDIRAVNGVIHIIDRVLIPPIPLEVDASQSAEASTTPVSAPAEKQPSILPTLPASVPFKSSEEATLLDIVSTHPQLAKLYALLSASNQTYLLDTPVDGQLTIFAPTNNAIDQFDPELVNGLLTDATQGEYLMRSHLLDGNYSAEQLLRAPSLVAQTGQPVSLIRLGNLTVVNENIRIVESDIEAVNGTIHIVEGVLAKFK